MHQGLNRKPSMVLKKLVLWSYVMMLSSIAIGQTDTDLYRVSYINFFGVNHGIQVEKVISFNDRSENGYISSPLKLNPHIVYFSLPDLNRNLKLGLNLEFSGSDKVTGIYPMLSLGVGYVMTFSNYDGLVHLNTGEIENNTRTEHSILPQVNFGLGWNMNNKSGLFLRFSFGRQLSFDNTNASIIGAEIGFQINLKKK